MLDVLHPLLFLARGLGGLCRAGRNWWSRTPRERRGPTLGLASVCLLLTGLLPYGPALLAVALLAAAAWCARGTGHREAEAGPDAAGEARLQAVYEALVPYFARTGEPGPHPLYAAGGAWRRAVEDASLTAEGRIARLLLRYPASFRDGEPAERLRVERLLVAKCGRSREYRFDWDEERNRLTMRALRPLPTTVGAQPFVTAPGETVLGLTDPDAVWRRMPVRVTGADTLYEVPPVIWRTGPRSTAAHLLAVGPPGSGTSTLLRSIATQAMRRGDVLVVDGCGGEFAFLSGRPGVLAVESSLAGVAASLEWLGYETERRLREVSRARQAGLPVPPDVRRPLWLLVDRPSMLGQLAEAEGGRDPRELLRLPLRHGRAAGVTVAVAEQFEGIDRTDGVGAGGPVEPGGLGDSGGFGGGVGVRGVGDAGGPGGALWAHARARVVLGAVSPERAAEVLGEAPPTLPGPEAPAGRGFARLGSGPVLRLQVPPTPDPFDETSGTTAEREAVRALLPERTAEPEAAGSDPSPAPGSGPGPVFSPRRG
ncbi:hypothetical protein [Streptomyces sp. AJS327]|uniref:hypothetical protein n=1 Tax=Streptomyces sp. AJS327 TaxID=2545265 RepID=UPI0015DF727D|nr:hypothetical protein [Streptomyces sp. AJS327]